MLSAKSCDQVDEHWEILDDFPEVPAELMLDTEWEVTGQGAWRYPLLTHLGEARAANESLIKEVLRAGLSRRQILRIGDNLGVVLALGRKESLGQLPIVEAGEVVSRCAAGLWSEGG